MTFVHARLEINRLKLIRVWRLEGLCAWPLPATIRSGGPYDVWIPTETDVALTGEGVLTAEVTGSGDDVVTKVNLEGTSHFRLE